MALERKYFPPINGREEWCVTGSLGSLSFWVSRNNGIVYGGVESHYKNKPDYLGDGSFHEHCPFNDGPCWHDGTSLWASEYWIPNILPGGSDAIFSKLEFEYPKRLGDDE